MEEPKLLVVDDDAAIGELLGDLGETCGYSVDKALNVKEFNQLYKESTPTLIILDLSIGEEDGIEILRFLSKVQCKSPIILMSGHEEKVRSTAFRLGEEYGLNMLTHVEKPIDLQKIKPLLEQNKRNSTFINSESLKRALKEFEFELYYQPLISLKSRELLGAEALLRWQPKNHPLILPDAFVPLAEEIGLVIPLTEWVIEQAFSQLAVWSKKNLAMKIHINLSPKLLNILTLPDQITVLSKKHEIDNNSVCFEVTESFAMNKPRTATDILTRLRLKGFSLSLDDFGTGYSSLVELYRLPFRQLKIDKMFVLKILEDQECINIVHSIIQLAHNLNMEVVAEGIESREAFDKLEKMGCDSAQGFYMGRPMPASDFDRWMVQNIDKQQKFIHKK